MTISQRIRNGFLIVACAATSVTGQTGDVTGVHDPCIARQGNAYYVFSTGPRIDVRRSPDLLHWQRVGSAFGELPAWAQLAVPGVKALWAPDVSNFESEYHLYYAVSTFGTNRSFIGLATNTTLDPTSLGYRWVDRGPVIASTPGRDDWNAIDPNVIFDESGQPWLAFGASWSGIKLCRLDRRTGKLADNLLYSVAGRGGGPIEAPFIVRRGNFFYLFVSFDRCCKGVDSTYKIMVGRSQRLTGPYVDRGGNPMIHGGGTLVLASYGRFRGPGHNAVLQDKNGDWLVHHYYDASASGRPTLQIRPLVWATDDWPLAGEPIEETSKPDKPSPEGIWDHSVDFGAPKRITLSSGGGLNGANSSARWSVRGRSLTLRSPAPEAPGGAWIDELVLAPNGRSYVGRNQLGSMIRGVCVSE